MHIVDTRAEGIVAFYVADKQGLVLILTTTFGIKLSGAKYVGCTLLLLKVSVQAGCT